MCMKNSHIAGSLMSSKTNEQLATVFFLLDTKAAPFSFSPIREEIGQNWLLIKLHSHHRKSTFCNVNFFPNILQA